MPRTIIGNIVNWFDDERVDIPDMEALQTLVYEKIAEILGGVFGRLTSGLLSRTRFNISNTAAVTVEPFYAIHVEEDDLATNPPGYGVPIKYDRRLSWQASGSTPSLDFTGRDGTKPFIWAKRAELEFDTAARRVYSETDSDEILMDPTPQTRVREIVLLGLSNISDDNLPPDDTGGWITIARATSVALPAITIWPRYAWDLPDAVEEASAVSPGILSGTKSRMPLGTIDSGTAVYGPQKSAGLAARLTAMTAALARIVDSRWEHDPANNFVLLSDPPPDAKPYYGFPDMMGLLQLKEAVAGAPLNGPVLAQVYVTYSAPNFVIAGYSDTAAIVGRSIATTALGAGARALLTLYLDTGYQVTGYNVTHHNIPGFDEDTVPYDTVCASQTVLPSTASGAYSFEIANFFKGNAGNNDFLVGTAGFTFTLFGHKV